MKKSIICLIVAAGMAVSCDPIKDEKDFDIYSVSASEIENAISFTQTDANGNPAADGNYFTYTTNPAIPVTIFNYMSDGSENMLAHGMSGSFVIKPKRGSDPNQTYYVRFVDSNNNPVDIKRTCNVYVQQELDPEIRLLASDVYGKKIWKWDTSITGTFWGNMGYCGGSGDAIGIDGGGAQWWGMSSDADFPEQLQHSHDGAYHGEGLNAWMEFSDEGIITCYNENGEVYQSGPFSVEGWNPNGEWRKGLLKTTSILWPYQVNWASNGFDAIPGEYEIVYLTADKMTLVYPDGGDYGGLGNWGEATYWHFKSNSDIEGMALGYGKTAKKSWTWDTSITGAVWGNMGYCGGAGADVGTAGNGQWWGIDSSAEFNNQLQHSEGGVNHGDGHLDAYMTFDADGIVTSYGADGSVVHSGAYEFAPVNGNEWKVADLNTSAGAILWPYEINSGGNMPTTFEVVYLTNDKMTLVYPAGGDFGSLGGWGEATFWHFKAK